MKPFHIFVISLIILSVLIPVSQAKPISVTINGPTMVGTNNTYEYKIIITGFFTKYSYHLFMAGSNLTGATTGELYGTSSSNIFYVNITFPELPQTVYIYVMAIGYVNGSSPAYTTSDLAVNVVKSVPIEVQIRNPSSFPVSNITVSFFLNGKYIGDTNISKISPNGTANATFYYVGNFEQGVNVISVRINSDVLKFSNGSNTTTLYFNYGPIPNYDWVWYLFAGIVIVVVFFVLIFVPGRKLPTAPKWKR